MHHTIKNAKINDRICQSSARVLIETTGPDASSLHTLIPKYLRCELPANLSAVKRHYTDQLKEQWAERWKASLRYKRMKNSCGDLNPRQLRRLLLTRRRDEMATVIQLRTGHAPLNKHLHRIKRCATPICQQCGRAPESTRHYIAECEAYDAQRFSFHSLLGRGGERTPAIFSTAVGIQQLVKYAAATRRLESTMTNLARPVTKP